MFVSKQLSEVELESDQAEDGMETVEDEETWMLATLQLKYWRCRFVRV